MVSARERVGKGVAQAVQKVMVAAAIGTHMGERGQGQGRCGSGGDDLL